MRPVLAIAVALAAANAAAEQPSLSGGIGAAIVDDSPATVLEAGLAIDHGDFSAGIGGRVTLLADGQLRTEDWDQISEWLTAIRYLRYHRDPRVGSLRVSASAGELADADIGFRGLVDGYTSSIDIDHRHLGIHSRVYARHAGGEVMLDDVAQPRIAAARAYIRPLRRLYLGVQGAGDFRAPSADGPKALAGLAADAAVSLHRSDRFSALAYTEAVAWIGLGIGLHTGGRARVTFADGWAAELDAVGQLGSDGYVAGYLDALYERGRYQHSRVDLMSEPLSQLDRARAGGLGGLGGMVRSAFAWERVGRLELGVGHRAGLGFRTRGRIAIDRLDPIQLAASMTSQELGRGQAWILASEARYRLPRGFFCRLQAAHLYRRLDAGMAGEVRPAWWLLAGLGIELTSRD